MFSIVFARAARKELEALSERLQERIIDKIESLVNTPYPEGCKKIKGALHSFRIRIGDYRVIYEIDNKRKIIDIAAVSHRQSVYKR